MYFGARIDAGFPFNKHHAQDTGGWVGPFNLIMASGEDDTDSDTDADDTNSDSTIAKLVDRYVARYVKSPLTPYLKMPKNCTLLGEEDFNKVAGPIAVDSTTKGQYDPTRNMNDQDYDPYHAFLGTCDNGDVQPYLPLFQFDFEQHQNTTANENHHENNNSENNNSDNNNSDNNKSENNNTVTESIQVKLNYKFLSMPHKNDYMYNLFPWVQRKFNQADLGFHISGPYCYGNDPKRGYTFDMNFDTRDPKAMLTLTHGCVEGLPCTPPAAELYNAQSGGGGHGSDIPVVPNVIPSNDGTTVKVGSSIFFILANVLSVLLLIWSCCHNRNLRGRIKQLEPNNNDNDNHNNNHNNNQELESLLDNDNQISYQRLQEEPEQACGGDNENNSSNGDDIRQERSHTNNDVHPKEAENCNIISSSDLGNHGNGDDDHDVNHGHDHV